MRSVYVLGIRTPSDILLFLDISHIAPATLHRYQVDRSVLRNMKMLGFLCQTLPKIFGFGPVCCGRITNLWNISSSWAQRCSFVGCLRIPFVLAAPTVKGFPICLRSKGFEDCHGVTWCLLLQLCNSVFPESEMVCLTHRFMNHHLDNLDPSIYSNSRLEVIWSANCW